MKKAFQSGNKRRVRVAVEKGNHPLVSRKERGFVGEKGAKYLYKGKERRGKAGAGAGRERIICGDGRGGKKK